MDPGAIVMIVMTGTVAIFSVPIVWILTVHQRKMAAIIHGSQRDQAATNSEALTQEVRDLKQMVFQQAIALDSLTTEVRKTLPSATSSDELANRLS